MKKQQLAGNVRRDENIADRAIEALWQDPFLDARGMAVHVQDGVVTLMGQIFDRAQLERAIELLADLPMIDEVVDGTLQQLRTAA